MTAPVSRLLVGTDAERQSVTDAGWLQWLSAHTDAGWRPGEWDGSLWLFTGDLDSDRTAAWRCRTPGCPTAARGFNGRCSSCRRARAAAGVCEEEFDRAPRRRPTRPVARGGCVVPDCGGELHCRGLCFRHERAWRKAGGGPLEEFIAQARPLIGTEPCLVAGCGRERVTRRGLCRFHGNRLQRQRNLASMSQEELAGWVADEKPRIAAHQFSLAGLPELVRLELLYALQRRDEAPPPLDPLQVRILISRLDGASSVRRADLETVCESGGVQYNSAIKGVFRDLRRHLERA